MENVDLKRQKKDTRNYVFPQENCLCCSEQADSYESIFLLTYYAGNETAPQELKLPYCRTYSQASDAILDVYRSPSSSISGEGMRGCLFVISFVPILFLVGQLAPEEADNEAKFALGIFVIILTLTVMGIIAGLDRQFHARRRQKKIDQFFETFGNLKFTSCTGQIETIREVIHTVEAVENGQICRVATGLGLSLSQLYDPTNPLEPIDLLSFYNCDYAQVFKEANRAHLTSPVPHKPFVPQG